MIVVAVVVVLVVVLVILVPIVKLIFLEVPLRPVTLKAQGWLC